MKPIILTVYTNNRLVRLNPSYIVAYFANPEGEGTCVVVEGEDNFFVKEIPDEIDDLLEDV